MNHQALSSFIWSVADLLRGDYKQSEYGKVILPFTILRRLDCVLECTKTAVLAEFEDKTQKGLNPDAFLIRNCHDFGALLAKAETYRTQWATNRQMNGTTARQLEQTQANINAAQEAAERIRNRQGGKTNAFL